MQELFGSPRPARLVPAIKGVATPAKGCPFFFRYVHKGEFTCENMFHSLSLLATFISFDFVYCTREYVLII